MVNLPSFLMLVYVKQWIQNWVSCILKTAYFWHIALPTTYTHSHTHLYTQTTFLKTLLCPLPHYHYGHTVTQGLLELLLLRLRHVMAHSVSPVMLIGHACYTISAWRMLLSKSVTLEVCTGGSHVLLLCSVFIALGHTCYTAEWRLHACYCMNMYYFPV